MIILPACCNMWQFYSLPQKAVLSFFSHHSFLANHFLYCFLDSCYFSCQTNLYFVSSPAFGCNRPLTRLQSHSSLQTSCSFISLRHPVSCSISPIFCFPTVDPNSPPQSYCCLHSFINSISFLPHSSALCFPLYCLEKSLRESQGQITQTTQDGQVVCLWLWW